MKAFFFTLLLITGFATALIGCTPKEAVTTDTPAQTKTLTVWTLQLQDYKPYFNSLFTRFEKTHPGLKVDWVDIPFAEGEKKALTAILSGHPPDIINLNPDFSAVLADKHALLNLNGWLTPQQKKNYLPVTLESCTLAKSTFLFGLPWYLTSQVTYYNQQLLSKAGWSHPPTTDAELLRFPQALRQKHMENVTAFFPTLAENGKFFRQLWQRGTLSGRGSGQEIKDSLGFWKIMIDTGLLPLETISMRYQDTVDRYQSGASVMLMSGTTAVKGLQQNAPEIYKQTRVTTQFPTRAPNTDFAVMTLVVPRQSEHPKEAVALVAFMTNPENTLAFAKLAPILPPGPSIQNRYFTHPIVGNLQSQALAMSARQVLKSKHGYQIAAGQKAKNDAIDFYVQSVLLNHTSINEATNKLKQLY